MFGALDLSTVRDLTLNDPVIQADGWGNCCVGVVAGYGRGAQIRGVTINNPAIRCGYADCTLFAGGVVGYARDSLDSFSVWQKGVLNGVDIYEGSISFNARWLGAYGPGAYGPFWGDGGIIYIGGAAGANVNGAISNAAVYGTEINVGSVLEKEIWKLFAGGIAGYTSAVDLPMHGICILNSVSMARFHITPNLTAHEYYAGGICGLVNKDSVVNTVYISDQAYDIFGAAEAGGYTISHNYKYDSVPAAYEDGVVSKLNNINPGTGGFWTAASVMDTDTGYGFEECLRRLKIWSYKTVTGADNTPYLCDYFLPGALLPDAPNLDTASSRARDGVNCAYKKGFVPPDILDNYAGVITRSEFCRMAVLFIEFKTGHSIDSVLFSHGVDRDPDAFTDTDDPSILAAYALQVTLGTGDGKFSPDGIITREQSARFMYNIGNVLGWDTANAPDAGFTDAASFPDWAVDAVNFCYYNNIMLGTSTTELVFSPKMIFSREQSIVMFDRMGPGFVAPI